MSTITPEAESLFAIARHFDRLPLDEKQRAEVFHAYETAPDEPILYWPHPDAVEGAFDEYCESPAGRAWRRVRDFHLHRGGGSHYATTLHEASGYESAPTKSDLLKTLTNAEHLLDPDRKERA